MLRFGKQINANWLCVVYNNRIYNTICIFEANKERMDQIKEIDFTDKQLKDFYYRIRRNVKFKEIIGLLEKELEKRGLM